MASVSVNQSIIHCSVSSYYYSERILSVGKSSLHSLLVCALGL